MQVCTICILTQWHYLLFQVERIIFCTYSPEDKYAYDILLPHYFPPVNGGGMKMTLLEQAEDSDTDDFVKDFCAIV